MLTETVISADIRVRFLQYLKDLWNYRDLFRALVERDIKVRYKQTVLGVLWVIIPPVVNAAIFYVIFVRVAGMSLPQLPPILFFMAGSIPWNCFATGVSQAASSLENSAGLISKVYFPRIIVPLSAIMGTVFDFSISWLFFNVVALIWGFWTWLFIPFTVVLMELQLSVALGLGMILAILNAQYRDIRYVIPWLIQVGMLITPVVWPMERLLATRLGESLEIFLYINPMAGVIESYRALMLEGAYIPYKLLAANFVSAAVIIFIGIWFFRSREQRLVDVL